MFGKTTEERVAHEADKIASLKDDLDALSWGRVMELGKLLQKDVAESVRRESARELVSIAQSNISLYARLGIDTNPSASAVTASGMGVLEGGFAAAALEAKNGDTEAEQDPFEAAFEPEDAVGPTASDCADAPETAAEAEPEPEPEPEFEEAAGAASEPAVEFEGAADPKAEFATEVEDEPEPEPEPEPESEPEAENASAAEPEPVVEHASKAARGDAPLAEPANEPADEPAVEPANEPADEPADVPSVEPVDEPVAAKPASQPQSRSEKRKTPREKFARFRTLYQSRDGSLCVFEDERGHLVSVDASKLA